jgi:hypothetical protein
MIGNLIGVVASRHRDNEVDLEGTIQTNSTDINYIGTTMRATAGELLFDGAEFDHVLFNKPFDFLDGMYIEYRAKQSVFDLTYRVASELIDVPNGFVAGGGVQTGGGAGNLFDSSAGGTRVQVFSSGMTVNTWYTFRWERTGDTFEFFRDGISQGTDTEVGFVLRLDGLGHVRDANKFFGTIDYFDLNGDKFNFNETGNNPTVTIG